VPAKILMTIGADREEAITRQVLGQHPTVKCSPAETLQSTPVRADPEILLSVLENVADRSYRKGRFPPCNDAKHPARKRRLVDVRPVVMAGGMNGRSHFEKSNTNRSGGILANGPGSEMPFGPGAFRTRSPPRYLRCAPGHDPDSVVATRADAQQRLILPGRD